MGSCVLDHQCVAGQHDELMCVDEGQLSSKIQRGLIHVFVNALLLFMILSLMHYGCCMLVIFVLFVLHVSALA